MKKIKLLLLAAICFVNAYAQKLPNVQQVSLRAPANIKIDGKLTEWNNQLQAYNAVNKVFYTLANDDVKLYITLCADEQWGIKKIIEGGVTITLTTVNQPDTKTKAQRIDAIITYPVLANTKEAEDLGIAIAGGYEKSLPVGGTKADSISNAANKKFGQLFKLIGINGIKSINESTISIYNNHGIDVSVKINNDMKMVYEMAVPLKYVNIAPNSTNKLRYSIKLNGQPEVATNGIGRVQFANPAAVLPPESMYMRYPTYFSGEYELAK